MRTLILALALATGISGLYGCTSADPGSWTYQTASEQTNACGPGIRRSIDAC